MVTKRLRYLRDLQRVHPSTYVVYTLTLQGCPCRYFGVNLCMYLARGCKAYSPELVVPFGDYLIGL